MSHYWCCLYQKVTSSFNCDHNGLDLTWLLWSWMPFTALLTCYI